MFENFFLLLIFLIVIMAIFEMGRSVRGTTLISHSSFGTPIQMSAGLDLTIWRRIEFTEIRCIHSHSATNLANKLEFS